MAAASRAAAGSAVTLPVAGGLRCVARGSRDYA